MLLSREQIAVATTIVDANDFYKPSHVLIFSAITQIFRRGEPVNCVTVAAELRAHDLIDSIGGAATLVSLQSNTPAISAARSYARIVRDTARLRRLQGLGAELTELGLHSTTSEEALEKASALITDLHAEKSGVQTLDAQAITQAGFNELLRLISGEVEPGLLTGFPDLDNKLLQGGFRKDEFVVVGARPSMGKSSFALALILYVIENLNRPVLLFSLEMGATSIWQRSMSAMSKVPLAKIRTGSLHLDDSSLIGDKAEQFGRLPLFVNDSPSTTIADIRAEAVRLKMKCPELAMIVVDYLQLVNSGPEGSENRQLEIANIARQLKILARDLETPVVALSQLSRNLESRSDKRPILSDLRESGEIESAADLVMFLYRDEVYDADSPNKGTAEVSVAKNRNGETGKVDLAWSPRTCTFLSLQRV